MDRFEIAKMLRKYSEPVVAYKLDAEFAAAVTQAAIKLAKKPALDPCPFCGMRAKIVICDDEGNIHDEDYRNNPYSGLSFGIIHDSTCADDDCPIATYAGDGILGRHLYDTKDDAIEAWNRRSQ